MNKYKEQLNEILLEESLRCNINMVKLMIANGADITAKSKNSCDQTALHLDSIRGRFEIVKLLLENNRERLKNSSLEL